MGCVQDGLYNGCLKREASGNSGAFLIWTKSVQKINFKKYLESRKVYLYICGMSKTIKIPNAVHQELKRFVADNPKETMEDMAGFAILSYLKEMGHKFMPIKKQSKK